MQALEQRNLSAARHPTRQAPHHSLTVQPRQLSVLKSTPYQTPGSGGPRRHLIHLKDKLKGNKCEKRGDNLPLSG